MDHIALFGLYKNPHRIFTYLLALFYSTFIHSFSCVACVALLALRCKPALSFSLCTSLVQTSFMQTWRHPQKRKYIMYCNAAIGRVSYITIYLCYFCFRWKTVSLVQASMQQIFFIYWRALYSVRTILIVMTSFQTDATLARHAVINYT